jgi:hydrogenase/urease accessory protein HupE
MKGLGFGLLGLVLAVCVTTRAWAHDIQQVFARVTLEEDRWEGVVDLDGLMLWEYAQGGVVLEDGSNGWYAGLDASQAKAFMEYAELFWRDRFAMSLDGRECGFEVSLPDPLLLQEDVARSPREPLTVVLRMEGTYAPGGGTLRVTWADTEPPTPETVEPDLAVGVLVPGSNLGTTVVPVEEGEEVEIGEREGAAGDEVTTKEAPASFWLWLRYGFEHILPKGVDHILFILGLFMLVPKWKPLLAQSAAFTVAHSITLAMVVLGVFAAPSQVVEPLIALSIAYVGIENLFLKELKPWRLALVFGLGLLHGMGFAGVMQELPVPQDQILAPLVGFNLGVEVGQVAVLAGAFALSFWMLGKEKLWKWTRLAGSAAIASVGLYWTVTRLMG